MYIVLLTGKAFPKVLHSLVVSLYDETEVLICMIVQIGVFSDIS